MAMQSRLNATYRIKFWVKLSLCLILAASGLLPGGISDAKAEAGITAAASAADRTITIKGSIASGEGREVTVIVTNPRGEAEYLNQMTSGEDGHYQFVFTLNSVINGVYQVRVGGTGIEEPVETTFRMSSGQPGSTSPPAGGMVLGADAEWHSFGEGARAGVQYKANANELKNGMTGEGKPAHRLNMDTDTLAHGFAALRNQKENTSGNGAGSIMRIIVQNTLPAVVVSMPVHALIEGAKKTSDAIVVIQTSSASYHLPIGRLDLQAWVKDWNFDVHAADINVEITHEQMSGGSSGNSGNGDIEKALLAQELKPLTGAFGFKLVITSPTGERAITDYNGVYVERMIHVPVEVDSNRSTGVLYDPVTKNLSFAPTLFEMIDGKRQAVIKRPGNSIYLVVHGDKSFSDISAHWARADIEQLASKLIVHGMTTNAYAPDAPITRAQFATLLVRALGLAERSATASAFRDVRPDDWHAGTVAAAVDAGLITGYEDGTFRPNEQITREQLAVMAVRALKAAGKSASVHDKRQSELFMTFSDADAISVWAREAVAEAMQAGVMNGMADNRFEARKQATRAQAAVMLKRLLQYVEFIN